jgi:hypothetical protein
MSILMCLANHCGDVSNCTATACSFGNLSLAGIECISATCTLSQASSPRCVGTEKGLLRFGAARDVASVFPPFIYWLHKSLSPFVDNMRLFVSIVIDVYFWANSEDKIGCHI